MGSASHYQHHSHAANLSDLVKHLCLSALRHQSDLEIIWDAFAARPYTPCSQLAGREDLLRAWMALRGPAPLTAFQEILRNCRSTQGEAAYPGSASILAGFAGVKTLLLSDLDPDCTTQQLQVFSQSVRPRVEVLNLDSVQAAEQSLAYQPDLVFIDPPFLQQQEWDGIEYLLDKIDNIRDDTRIVIWYPLREGFGVPTSLQQYPAWRMQFHYDETQGLQGCVVWMANFGMELEALLRPLAACLDASRLPGLHSARCLYQD